MKSTLMSLQGVNVLSKAQQKQIKGSGPCGVKMSNGNWYKAPDLNGDGKTKDDATQFAAEHGLRWCCDSCPWNN